VKTKIVGVKDKGNSFVLELKSSAGPIIREIKKDYGGGSEKIDPQYRKTILKRNFDFRKSKSMVFIIEGGIGDIVIGLESINNLRSLCQKIKRTKFEIIGVFHNRYISQFFERFLNHFPLFDRIIDEDNNCFVKYDVERFTVGLDIIECNIAIDNVWNLNWAKWGIPGRFNPNDVAVSPGVLKKPLDKEYERLRLEAELPNPNQYILLSPTSNALSHLKTWPKSNWKRLQEKILRGTNKEILLLINKAWKNSVWKNERVFTYNYDENPESTDFLSLLSFVQNAAGVVSVDSGPALAAGFLGRPCVTLWGPSSPIYFGHYRNFNMRMSLCPPCWMQERRLLCTKNACMSEIHSDDVYTALMSQMAERK
jgi:ADP-heptose:LPS heptosyltransferase